MSIYYAQADMRALGLLGRTFSVVESPDTCMNVGFVYIGSDLREAGHEVNTP